jgi:hypothetical protein
VSQFKRGAAASLLIQVSSSSESALHRHCPRCKQRRPFVSSGKFRVNAQKKRIDAWLIFLCTACDDRWNWPIHARRPVGALDPAELDALMRNDPALAARHARTALRQNGGEIAVEAPTVTLKVITPATEETVTVEIVVAVIGAGPRLDRLLAQMLMLGRQEIAALDRTAALAFLPAARRALRRPAAGGQRIIIDLTACNAETAARLRQRLAVSRPACTG